MTYSMVIIDTELSLYLNYILLLFLLFFYLGVGFY